LERPTRNRAHCAKFARHIASLRTSSRGEVAQTSGSGRWRSGVTSAVAGKKFNVDFVSKEPRPYVSMIVILEMARVEPSRASSDASGLVPDRARLGSSDDDDWR
jgi:hypothetical protein